MMSSTSRRWRISSRLRRPPIERVPEQAAAHLQHPPGHDVVEHAHALEQRQVLEGAGDAQGRGLVRAHAAALLALEGDEARLRMVEAVDDVEDRGLARAVGADDGADLALADVEADRVERAHAAEAQRDVFGGKQHLIELARAGSSLRGRACGGGSCHGLAHSAASKQRKCRRIGQHRAIRRVCRHVNDPDRGFDRALAAILERDGGGDMLLLRRRRRAPRPAAHSARR